MKNVIQLTCDFCFKGRSLDLSLNVDLDDLMQRSGQLPDFYPLLAHANNIDLYSYEYEMLEAEEICVTALDGWVAEFVQDGVLDQQGFMAQWAERRELQTLSNIALQHLGIADLTTQPNLLAALTAAFRLGKSAA